jgi:hypothetical protein
VKTQKTMCTAVTVIIRVCKPVRLLHLLVVTNFVHKWSINRVTNPNPVYSHTLTRDIIKMYLKLTRCKDCGLDLSRPEEGSLGTVMKRYSTQDVEIFDQVSDC